MSSSSWGCDRLEAMMVREGSVAGNRTRTPGQISENLTVELLKIRRIWHLVVGERTTGDRRKGALGGIEGWLRVEHRDARSRFREVGVDSVVQRVVDVYQRLPVVATTWPRYAGCGEFIERFSSFRPCLVVGTHIS